MFPQCRKTRSWTSRSDVATIRTRRQRHRRPGRPLPTSDSSTTRSRQRAPRAVTQLFQRKHPFHPLARGRKLPGRKHVYICVLTNLCLFMRVAFHATLYIRSIFEGFRKLLFLLQAMRTPPGPVHLDAAIRQAARKAVVLVLRAVAEIIGKAERGQDQHGVNRAPAPVDRAGRPRLFLLRFSSLL